MVCLDRKMYKILMTWVFFLFLIRWFLNTFEVIQFKYSYCILQYIKIRKFLMRTLSYTRVNYVLCEMSPHKTAYRFQTISGRMRNRPNTKTTIRNLDLSKRSSSLRIFITFIQYRIHNTESDIRALTPKKV